MRNLVSYIALLMALTSWSCTSFDQAYYEKASGVKLPVETEVIESFDNGEYLTVTSLKSDSISLAGLIKKYNFEKRSQASLPAFTGLNYLKEVKPDLIRERNLYVKSASKGGNSWLYIIDLKQHILWAQIQYPDWGGT
ncbi:hypothetical protein [Fibrella forsythiae]|uniref:Lipoprotein n=1 Tax=Fibrella forsythiae TaxID=2817061 RepID=A0ABS3JKZ5_9BACT|nr:hypothetical protein [Fibrella forsythiae]MBO0950679.1 hypothetical protein [Fibrella forsythiae]